MFIILQSNVLLPSKSESGIPVSASTCLKFFGGSPSQSGDAIVRVGFALFGAAVGPCTVDPSLKAFKAVEIVPSCLMESSKTFKEAAWIDLYFSCTKSGILSRQDQTQDSRRLLSNN